MTINKKYPEADTPMLACLHAIDRAVDEMAADNEAAGIPSYNNCSDDIKSDLFSLVITGSRPFDYFEELGCGCYKECYSLFGNWIVKFASPRNNTSSEKQILEAATEAGLSQIFLKTIFIDLPIELPATFASSDDSNYNESSYEDADSEDVNDSLDTIIFQPRVTISSELPDKSMPCTEEEYDEDPLYFTNGDKVPFAQYYSTGIYSFTWLQNCINTYGDDIFNKLCDFINHFRLTDLHTDNTGYLVTPTAELPIILDWISSFNREVIAHFKKFIL